MEEKEVVFVTGGSRGIGKAIALKYAENGYNVVINYVSGKTDVEELKKEFEEKGAESLILKADVSKTEEVENVIKQAGSEYNVSLIANYVYDLAKEYNQFYHDFTILREKSTDLRDFRLLLSKNVANTIKRAMSLLGIDVPERMWLS